eukprot:TRINITY_DN7353_c0_g1_i7.p1 TRINITY_DN7353_c0_g1~~TRINITY_DN7353_c0_g1_i7.p1  ORF type:complete len:229 (+),score=37.43 TRINITY_DN7353_c0_g1_i7:65-751(+)
MIRRPPRSTLSSSSAASDVYKRQVLYLTEMLPGAPQEEEDLNLIAQQSIPEPEEEWLCPITRDVIYCPVLLNQQVYELDALAGWLAKHPTNPLTRAPFDYDTSLVVDTELRGLMATWRRRAVKSHRECAGACSSDASRVAYHLAAALEADPRDVESYSLLATHLEVEGDQHAAVEVRAEVRSSVWLCVKPTGEENERGAAPGEPGLRIECLWGPCDGGAVSARGGDRG